MHSLASALIPAIEVMFVGGVLENETSAHGNRNRERH